MEHRASSLTIVFLLAVGVLQLGLAEEVLPTVQSGMRVAVLRVGAPDGTPSQIVFGTDKNQFSLGVNAGGEFLFSRNARPLLLIHPDDTLEVSAAEFAASSLELRGNIEVEGVKQFRIIAREDLSKEAKGWDNPASAMIVSRCAGIPMLGGFGKFAKGEITKTYRNLPPHRELRVKATFHFIDAWIGETAFMRLNIGEHGNMVHVWTERHSQDMEQEAVNVCGGAVGEGKFASPIDVIIPHEEDSIIVGFGSTIQEEDPYDQSWGVSGIELYVR